MEITYLGHSAFEIKTRTATVVTDPFDEKVGYKMPKVSAEIVTISHDHDDHNNFEAVSGTKERPESFVISGPGEYEVSGVFVLGLPTFHDQKKGRERGKNTVYLFTVENLRVCHLGDLGHSLKEKKVERLGQIDILLIPVGGKYTLGPKEAVEVVNQLEPKIVIPMHYQLAKSELEILPVGGFLEEMDVKNPEKMAKLKIKPDQLPEETQVILLNKK